MEVPDHKCGARQKKRKKKKKTGNIQIRAQSILFVLPLTHLVWQTMTNIHTIKYLNIRAHQQLEGSCRGKWLEISKIIKSIRKKTKGRKCVCRGGEKDGLYCTESLFTDSSNAV